jgi:hypothetical protein
MFALLVTIAILEHFEAFDAAIHMLNEDSEFG